MPEYQCKEFLDSMKKVDDLLLSEAFNSCSSSPIFILGAPRTGSTIFYQAMVNCFGLPFISNLTNNFFPEIPIVGFAIQNDIQVDAIWYNQFGKTEGIFEPSEGSAVMSHWFGGGHPSQTVSTKILDGREEHFLSTLAAAEKLFGGRSLLIKNPWNCFRIDYLQKKLPKARFIWIRRNIVDAAESDLEARYITKMSPFEWNSATPANVEELKKLPPIQQVVENQYEFSQAISRSLNTINPERSIELWYEDFIYNPERELKRISQLLGYSVINIKGHSIKKSHRGRQLSAEESRAIREYADKEHYRLKLYQYSA